MIESTLKIARYCPLVIQGFSNFLGLFQGIMANPGLEAPRFFSLQHMQNSLSQIDHLDEVIGKQAATIIEIREKWGCPTMPDESTNPNP